MKDLTTQDNSAERCCTPASPTEQSKNPLVEISLAGSPWAVFRHLGREELEHHSPSCPQLLRSLAQDYTRSLGMAGKPYEKGYLHWCRGERLSHAGLGSYPEWVGLRVRLPDNRMLIIRIHCQMVESPSIDPMVG